MKKSFSFSERPALFILNQFATLLPGIEKVLAVYHLPDNNGLVSSLLHKESGEYSIADFRIRDAQSVLDRYRRDTAAWTWLLRSELPFEDRPQEKVQLNIFNELNNNVLLIRIPNNYDRLNDLYFIFFDKGMSQFGTTIQGRDLATENKTAIAFLLRNSILTLLSNFYSDRDVFATLQENTRAIIGEVASLKNELSRVREKFRDGTVRLGMKYLEEISRNNGRKYGFSESAMKKLKDYQGELENLPAILDQAARYADTFSVEPEQEMTLISDFHIVFKETGPKVTPPKVLEYTGDVPAKYGKTLILLDKLENAALQVKSKNMLLTSQNLVGELPTPVSPPAISDALKKHRNKILYLFREFPTRWELIRKEFRPVQNILNVRQDRAQLTG